MSLTPRIPISRIPLRDNGTVRVSALLASTAYWPRQQVRRLKPIIDGVQMKASDTLHLEANTEHTVTVRDTEFTVCEEEAMLLAMYKPSGFVTGRTSDEGPTLYDLLPDNVVTDGLEPVGRLDKETSGLLLLTEDGQLNQQLRHPTRAIIRRYRATLARPVPQRIVDDAITQGVTLKDGHRVHPLRMDMIDVPHGAPQWIVEINEGKYHEVRRLFAAMGSHVTGLHREAYGWCVLDDTISAANMIDNDEIPRIEEPSRLSDGTATIACPHPLQRITGSAKTYLYQQLGLLDTLRFATIYTAYTADSPHHP